MEPSKSPTLPRLTLRDAAGRDHTLASARDALLCFVHDGCPTCDLTLPLLERIYRHFGGALDVVAIGQEAAGNAALVARHRLTVPMLDDSALKLSFGCDVEIVPTVILAEAGGAVMRRFEGFDRRDWRDLVAQLGIRTAARAPEIDWNEYPETRPGCGSRSVEPEIAERLRAEASGRRMGARRITLGEAQDPFEFMFEQGLTDGLPVIPPTPERVARMLAGTRRDPLEVVAVVPPNLAPATVEKVAANAVMAGCRPEYLPVVIAALEAACTDTFNAHGIMATTAGATPIIVVNGPIRRRLGMNMGIQALGSGFRPNATIGRALKLALRNIGGARPGDIERSTLGAAGKYTMCIAEWEERSPWDPLHVERGFGRDESVVTLFGLESGSHQMSDHTARTARALGGSLGKFLAASTHPKSYRLGEVLLVISPEHADTFARDKWTKAQIRERILEVSARRARELLPEADIGEGMSPAMLGLGASPSAAELDALVMKFRKPENIAMMVAGGEAGKFTAVFGGWFGGPAGSMSVSRRIEEVP